ncbi:MAG: ribosome biogenesis GTP-binding protein YihA/YsxC [Gemmatimonadales bacterium]|nr:ribosome biogenesis GTP-binding protein YihA/YsxC [Gemmatimonadales bacterium]
MAVTTVFSDLPVEFIGSFPDPRHPLVPPLPELIFLGRSNVGKSSLINALAGRRIAKTSGTPGKTQFLNAFRFPGFYLIDLPGYGYAKLARTERGRLRKLVKDVIATRSGHGAVVWLLDIRHPPSEDDLAMADLLADAGRETVIVLTKGDKLSQAQRHAATRARADDLGLDSDDLLLTSSAKGFGIAELARHLDEATRDPNLGRGAR